MARSQHDFGSIAGPGSAHLHPTSTSFGLADAAEIERSFLATARRLNSVLLRLIDDITAGSIGLSRFTSAGRAAIFESYYVTYSLGAISIFPFYTMTERDTRILDEELLQETRFLASFGRDISSGDLSLDPVQRSRLYLLGLRGIFERGRLEAMPPGPYQWRLGISEHCSNCFDAAYNGPYQRDSTSGLGLPVIPGAPGDGSVCLGLTRCGCTFTLASGTPLPNSELAERLRGLLLEVADGTSSPATRS